MSYLTLIAQAIYFSIFFLCAKFRAIFRYISIGNVVKQLVHALSVHPYHRVTARLGSYRLAQLLRCFGALNTFRVQ